MGGQRRSPLRGFVRDVLVGLDDLEKTMEPLEKVRDFVWLLEGKFGSLEEGLKAMELDARERLVFVDLASTIEGATLALERISEQMHAMASHIEQLGSLGDSPQKPSQVEDSEETAQPEVESSLFPVHD
jgi:hypothetical protein